MTVVHALSMLALALGQAEGEDPRPFPPEVVTTAPERPRIPLSEPRLIPIEPDREREKPERRRDEEKGCAAPREDDGAASRDAPR